MSNGCSPCSNSILNSVRNEVIFFVTSCRLPNFIRLKVKDLGSVYEECKCSPKIFLWNLLKSIWKRSSIQNIECCQESCFASYSKYTIIPLPKIDGLSTFVTTTYSW